MLEDAMLIINKFKQALQRQYTELVTSLKLVYSALFTYN